jgi:hypothetical protein
VRRPRLEVADVFHRHGADWRRANAGHVSLGQLQVMSAIEQRRSAALGGHLERCEDCGRSRIAYNSCRNRHCPKCQGAAAKDWLAAREADLLLVSYLHVVFTLPAEIAPIAYQNKALVYHLLLRTAAETLLTIAADPRHLGARIAISNSRLVALDERGVTFRYKDYRRDGQARYRTMTLTPGEFIRRFLLHVLPKGFHRIRHDGLLASAGCKANIARAKELMAAPMPQVDPPAAHDTADPHTTTDHRPPCPCCGGRMIIVEVFARGGAPRGPPSSGAGIRI